jgi:hypothetical protein
MTRDPLAQDIVENIDVRQMSRCGRIIENRKNTSDILLRMNFGKKTPKGAAENIFL